MGFRSAHIALVTALALACLADAEQAHIAVPTDTGAARVGVPHTLAYTLHWPEDGGPYVLIPPMLAEIGWADWRITSIRAVADAADPRAIVNLELSPTQEGDYALPALDFAYFADDEAVDLNAEAQHLVRSAPVPITVRAAATAPPLPIVLGGAAALTLVLGLGGWTVLGRTRRSTSEPKGTLSERIQDALHAAQRHRLDGDFYAYYQELTRAAEMTAAEDTALLSRLRARTQSVGYGGTRPTEDELNGDQRAIDRAVARWKEQSEA